MDQAALFLQANITNQIVYNMDHHQIPTMIPDTAPVHKKPRATRAPRKGGPRTLEQGINDMTLTPNNKKKHNNRRSTPKDISVKNPISPPPFVDQSTSIEQQLSTSPGHASLQKKKRNRKKTGERNQQENMPTLPQSPPTEPSMAHGTPARALLYAGPTFHASPAPSSIPLPKFFAQSAPAVRAMGPLESVSDDSPSDDSSNSQTGGDSPTMRPSLRALQHQPREASPLDIFFKADQQEKAAQKARIGSSLAFDRSESISPPRDVFGSPLQSPFSKPQTPQADPHYAKTQALKQLLLFPQAQKSPPVVASHSGTPFLDVQSSRPSALGRTRSDMSTPTMTSSSFNDSISIFNDSMSEMRSDCTSPSINTPPTSGWPTPVQSRRPLPGHLRQELLNSLPLDQSPDVSARSARLLR